jgi:hypothetical protein
LFYRVGGSFIGGTNQHNKMTAGAFVLSYKRLVKLTLQSILLTFYEQLLRQFLFAKKLQTQTLSKEKLLKTLSYAKLLMKR